MAELLQWDLTLFILIMARWSGMIMLAPVFGARGVPAMVRVSLAFGLGIILYPLIYAMQPVIPGELLHYVAVLLKEVFVGLTIGFVIYAFTAVLQGAGQLMDFPMGFHMGSSVDPVYGTQTPMMGNFHIILATMFLLASNLHHYLIAAMVRSYAYIDISPNYTPVSAAYYVFLLMSVVTLSLQIAAPITGALLVSDVGVGLLARTVPQIQIFSVIFPVKIMVGMILVFFMLTFFGETITYLFHENMSWILKLYQGWKL